jgi:DNA-binding LacI/PurR family transcriptional regulator
VNAAADNIDFPRVSTDDAVAMEQAHAHLTYLGHERVGLILGPVDHVPSLRKLHAFEQIGAGTQSAPDLVERTRFSIEGGHSAAAKLLGRGATAIICASDPLALGAVRAVRRAGRRVPTDVSVVGYDDSALMNCTEPPLTTVRQPIDAMGRMVIELLIAQIGGASVPHDELLFEPELVVRGSSGPAPAAAAS